MGQFLNQATRILAEMARQSEMTPEDYSRIFNISPAMLENRIKATVVTTGWNGKRAADEILKFWEKSHPDYIYREYKDQITIDGILFRMKKLEKSVLVMFKGPAGDFLHEFKFEGELNHESKILAASSALKDYNERTNVQP